MTMFDGAEHLGNLLTGGVDTTSSFLKGATQRVSLEEALARAKIKRDEALARTQVKQAMIDQGMKPEEAALLDSIMRSGMGSDYSAGQLGLGRGQENSARAAAAEAAKAGDLDLMNNMLAVANSSPMQTTTIDQGYVLNPHGDPSQTVTPTKGELADVLAAEALVGSRNAAAESSRARADLTRDRKTNPDRYRTPKKDAPSTEGTGTPKIGEVRKGYRYKGGDPAKKSSWEKA